MRGPLHSRTTRRSTSSSTSKERIDHAGIVQEIADFLSCGRVDQTERDFGVVDFEAVELLLVAEDFGAAGALRCRWREMFLRGGRVSVIWRTSCWKHARDARVGKAAAATPVKLLSASATQSVIARNENSRTTNQECTALRW